MAKVIDIEDLADEIIAGKWGNGRERQQKLTDAGLNYHLVQDYVNKVLNGTATEDDYIYTEMHKVLQQPDKPTNHSSYVNPPVGQLLPNAPATTTPKVVNPQRPSWFRSEPENANALTQGRAVINDFLSNLRAIQNSMK